MDGGRINGRPLYVRAAPDPYYQLYGTVRGNPTGKARPALDIEASKNSKKSFNFLPWKKNRSKTDDFLQSQPANLGRHNKYKFGSVSALSSSSLYKEWEPSLPYTTSFSASDLKHASVRSVQVSPRGTVTSPWENYHDPSLLNIPNNSKVLSNPRGEKQENLRNFNNDPSKFKSCTCEKKKTGPFGTLNFKSLKSSKCNCGFSSVRSSSGSFAPPAPPRRKSILPEKVDLYAVHEDQISHNDNVKYIKNTSNSYDTLNKRNKYKAPDIPTLHMKSQSSAAQAKFLRSLDKSGKGDPFSSISSRKSILECDVTAYDLVKSYLKSKDDPDSELDDDLSDNVIEGKESPESPSKTSKKKVGSSNPNNKLAQIPIDNSSSPVSSESESGIYSQPPSVRIGGHGMKINSNGVPNGGGSQTPSLYSEESKTNSVDSRTSSWSNSSTSDDGIYSLPEPDYDKDDYDTIIPYNDRINSAYTRSPSSLKKYASGDCLAPSESSVSKYRQYPSDSSDTSQFSTVRRASSLVTLAPRASIERIGVGSDFERLPTIPDPPQLPSSCSIPPPPPPPPPTSLNSGTFRSSDLNLKGQSLRLKSKSEESESDASSVSEYSKASTIKASQHNPSSSIAAELTEKLKGNQPLLRKKPMEVKPPCKVNSVNPYAEVKSILKKTAVDSGSTNAKSGESSEYSSLQQSPAFQEFQDSKKKKRVQFKSLSDESLVIEQIQHQSLSSSDEEPDETNQCTKAEINNSTNVSSSDTSIKLDESKIQSAKENDGGFTTVGELLSEKPKQKTLTMTHLPRVPLKINSQKPLGKTDTASSKKSEYKVPSKPNQLSRPSQPPPPPPARKTTSSTGGPPPRPLNSAPKSFSYNDLRGTNFKPGERFRKQLAVKTSIPVVTTSKQHLVGGNAYQNRNRPRSTTTHLTPPSAAAQNKSELSSACPKNGVPSPAASPEGITTSTRGKTTAKSGDDNYFREEALCHNHSTEQAECFTTLPEDGVDTSKPLPEIVPTQDNAESSNTTSCIRYDENRNNREPFNLVVNVKQPENATRLTNHDTTDNSDDDGVDANSVTKQQAVSKQQRPAEPRISCRIVSPPPPHLKSNENEKPEQTFCKDNRSKANKMVGSSSSVEDVNQPLEIEGPLYSNLLYVPLRNNTPSPPPLPSLPPPMKVPPPPPHRDATTVLTTPGLRISGDYDKSNYVTRCNLRTMSNPAATRHRGSEKNSGIYESQRCSDTGATIVTISNGVDPDTPEHIYASLSSDSIYEELPGGLLTDMNISDANPFGKYRGSFFEGASKAEILKYLEGAKDRVVHQIVEDDVENLLLDDYDDELPQTKDPCIQNIRNNPIRISNISSSSESSTLSTNSSGSHSSSDLASTKIRRPAGTAEVERADSGVGTETSRPHRSRKSIVTRRNDDEILCADCDQQITMPEQGLPEDGCCPLVCTKCDKKRSERKEIVTEIVETEFKYGKDLMIIKEEFYTPMEVAALLSKDQLGGIFLNLAELILVNRQFSEKLKDAVDIATEHGDEDYTTVNIGKLFLQTSTMLQAFEVYCVQQGSASVLLSNLEKEKELLRIFLKVSQMENTLLRRMNLSAFLMVPVQRVTKYPLLLNRLYKVTPYHHQDREALREAQLKIELHLEHINQQTKGVTGTKIWRRLSNLSANRRIINISDIGSIQFRKMAMEILGWSKEEIGFVMAGKLSFGVSYDFTRSRRGAKALRFAPCHALMATLGKPNSNYRPDLIHEGNILFPRNTGIRDTTLLLMKEKNGKYTLAREPLHLGSCIISSELEDDDIIEVQEHTTKESIYLKAECKTEALDWLKQLRYHAKDLGTWRRRRNALANIMINGMVRQ